MYFPILTLASALLATTASASNITFYADEFCGTPYSVVQSSDNLVCHQTASSASSTLPMSAVFHLSDFVSADLAGSVYTTSDCSLPCGESVVTVENESPNAQYPIANGQCVSAQTFGTSFGSYQFSAFR